MRSTLPLSAMLFTTAMIATACSSDAISAPIQTPATTQLIETLDTVDQPSAETTESGPTTTTIEAEPTTTTAQETSTTTSPPTTASTNSPTTEEDLTTTASDINIDPAAISFPSSVAAATEFTVSGPYCGDLVRIVILDPEGEPVFDSGRFELAGAGWSVSTSLDASSGTEFQLRVVCDIGDRSSLNTTKTISIN